MSYGLQVQNSGSDLVIDADFRNYEIIAEGTGTHVGSGLSAYVDISFPATSLPPLIFVRAVDLPLASATLIKDGSGKYSSARLYSSAPYNTFGFSWFVAAPADGLSGDTWGLQVFDGSAKKVFDSGEQYVQFRDVVTVDLDALAAGTGVNAEGYFPVTHASIANAYYCLPALRAFISNIVYEYPATFFPAVRAYSSTQAWLQLADRSFTGNWAPDPYTRHTAYLVVATKSA